MWLPSLVLVVLLLRFSNCLHYGPFPLPVGSYRTFLLVYHEEKLYHINIKCKVCPCDVFIMNSTTYDYFLQSGGVIPLHDRSILKYPESIVLELFVEIDEPKETDFMVFRHPNSSSLEVGGGGNGNCSALSYLDYTVTLEYFRFTNERIYAAIFLSLFSSFVLCVGCCVVGLIVVEVRRSWIRKKQDLQKLNFPIVDDERKKRERGGLGSDYDSNAVEAVGTGTGEYDPLLGDAGMEDVPPPYDSVPFTTLARETQRNRNRSRNRNPGMNGDDDDVSEDDDSDLLGLPQRAPGPAPRKMSTGQYSVGRRIVTPPTIVVTPPAHLDSIDDLAGVVDQDPSSLAADSPPEDSDQPDDTTRELLWDVGVFLQGLGLGTYAPAFHRWSFAHLLEIRDRNQYMAAIDEIFQTQRQPHDRMMALAAFRPLRFYRSTKFPKILMDNSRLWSWLVSHVFDDVDPDLLPDYREQLLDDECVNFAFLYDRTEPELQKVFGAPMARKMFAALELFGEKYLDERHVRYRELVTVGGYERTFALVEKLDQGGRI